MKKIVIFMIITGALLLSACSKHEISKDELPRVYSHGMAAIDLNDLKQVIGYADYVFVAKINKDIETEYRNQITMETEDGDVIDGSPFTKYSVTVLDNIKGKLVKNKETEIYKQGGITKDKKMVVLPEGDELLKVGSYYIIIAYAQPDGSILMTGHNSSILLDIEGKNEIVSSSEYKEVKKAFKEEIKAERIRYKATSEE